MAISLDRICSLDAKEAVDINLVYNDFATSRYEYGDAEKPISGRIDKRGSSYADALLKLKTITDKLLGLPMTTISTQGESLDPDTPIVRTIYRDVVKDVKDRMQAQNAGAQSA